MMRDPSSELKICLKKGAWSPEEDQMLISYIKRYAIWNWSQMPRFAGLSRSGRSCRHRWMNYLKPNVKRGNFSKEGEEIILHSHSLLGNRWSAIGSRLPGRTDNDIKYHWHTHLKKHAIHHNQLRITNKKKDMNTSLKFKADNVEKIHVNDIVSSPFLCTSNDDSSSSDNTTTSNDHEVYFKPNRYDINSPGTVDNLQYFWEQLCPLENLELRNNNQDMFSDPVFQDLYGDPMSLYSSYKDDYVTTRFKLSEIAFRR